MGRYLRIHELDNVAVAVDLIPEGSCVEIGEIFFRALEEVPAGHKVALRDVGEGECVVKYGMPIGEASRKIFQGEWVHTHNVRTRLCDVLDYRYEPDWVHDLGEKKWGDKKSDEKKLDEKKLGVREEDEGGSVVGMRAEDEGGSEVGVKEGGFWGFRRADGKVGIRNEIWIIPTVGCVNNVAQALARLGRERIRGSVADVVAFPHPYGCSQMGEDQENTRRILAGLMEHPNAGGVLLLGLGCENSGVEEVKKYCINDENTRISYLVCQEFEDEIEEGVKRLDELIGRAALDQREKIPASELIVGLKCGGSDGFSGITANPMTGVFSDLLIGCGGSTILTEVPEMFGAETILMNRCENEALFSETVKLINEFKGYFLKHGQEIYENPSPGNKKGGISTLEEKSMGCTQKSGSAPVSDVLSYGERVKKKGLSLLSAPGNDLVAATALAAAGAHLVLFTTGRGTPFASPVPTVKIATNHRLGELKKNWIDFDAGAIVDGISVKEMAEEFFDFVMEVAGGRPVKAEEAGYHDLAIFKQGVTL